MGHRDVAAHTLGWIGSPYARDALFELMKEGKRTASVKDLRLLTACLGYYHGPVTDVLLYQISADDGWPPVVRKLAVSDLIVNGGSELETRIERVISADKNGVLAHTIMYRLGLRGSRDLDHLVNMYLDHPDKAIREEAREVLRWRQ